jgi:prepilin peptidase CpaA
MLFVVGMAVAAAFDWRHRRIPNWLNLAICVVGLGVRGVSFGAAGVLESLGGAGVGLAILIAPFALGWMGGGDVKLAIAAGAWLGPRGALGATLWGLVLGGGLALVWLARRRALRREVTANLVGALALTQLPSVERRESADTLPLGVALAAAAVAVAFGGFHV